MSIQIITLLQQLDIAKQNINNDPIKLHEYEKKKKQFMPIINKYFEEQQEKKENEIQKETIINKENDVKNDKINNIGERAVFNMGCTNNLGICEFQTKYVNFKLASPDKWLYQYDIQQLKYCPKQKQYCYQINIMTIPKEHFIIKNNNLICFDLYIVDKNYKKITISFSDGNEITDGNVICGKCIFPNKF